MRLHHPVNPRPTSGAAPVDHLDRGHERIAVSVPLDDHVDLDVLTCHGVTELLRLGHHDARARVVLPNEVDDHLTWVRPLGHIPKLRALCAGAGRSLWPPSNPPTSCSSRYAKQTEVGLRSLMIVFGDVARQRDGTVGAPVAWDRVGVADGFLCVPGGGRQRRERR